jgi:tetratricopeptide (TPR) repeat protein
MAGGMPTVTQARFVERRQEIYDVFSTAFTAECMMMTPGLIEAWKDLDTGLYLFGAPRWRSVGETRERWQFEVLSFQRCLDDMLAAIDVVRARNPEVKILITTSPVPMARTFTGRDIAIANTHSKAVLRAVCDSVLLERDGVDYFPSYEMAMLSNQALVWKADRLHVSQAFVGKIVGHMLDHYMEGVEEAAAHYQRARTKLLGRAYGEAEAAAREALAARPDHLEARIVLGVALGEQRRWAEAETELRPAVEADSERSDALVQYANAVARVGRPEEAAGLLAEAMNRSSCTINDFLSAEDVLARVAPDDAVRLCERAVELFPRHIQAHERLTSTLLRAERKAEAMTALRRAATLSNPPAELLLQLAHLLVETGERDEAVTFIDKALNADPNRKDAMRLKAELLAGAAA